MNRPRLYKGMRDYLPQDMIPRELLLANIKKTFRRWGFVPVETPAIEYTEVLMGSKYGTEAQKLIYHIVHDDGLALRYDLTVPLARLYALNERDLPTPFKRYQIQPVWRAERAQPRQGRFREFYQCDVDIVGTDSRLSDAEIVAMTVDILSEIGFDKFTLEVNHRGILLGMVEEAGFPAEEEISVCQSLDKLDKIGEDGVRKELGKKGFSDGPVTRLFELTKGDLESFATFENQRISRGYAEMMEFFRLIERFPGAIDHIRFSPTLARGLDYYTGIIFESKADDLPHIGSLTGGGRYDGLIGTFLGRDVPAIGTTIGLDRILVAAEEKGLISVKETFTDVLFINFGDDVLGEVIELSGALREKGISCEIYLEDKKLKKQFSYADKKDIPFVVTIGTDEIAQKIARLKRMKTGEQYDIPFEELADRVFEMK